MVPLDVERASSNRSLALKQPQPKVNQYLAGENCDQSIPPEDASLMPILSATHPQLTFVLPKLVPLEPPESLELS